VIPEAFGGADMGFLTFGVVLEELGRQLTASPLLASGLVGATALVLGGTDSQKQAWLPKIAEGTAIVTLVHSQTKHFSWRQRFGRGRGSKGDRLLT
jgi:alkylation response protein AidB-like acyl-CoA dehydrogenase